MAKDAAPSLASLRLTRSVELAESGDSLWLRGPGGDEVLAQAVAALPAADRYELTGEGRLRRRGCRIPDGPLPTLTWQPLAAWLRVEMSGAALPGLAPRPVELRLVPSSEEVEPQLLITSLTDWVAFVRQAPLIRLERLRFSASADRRVLVWGTPLPPVPGKRYVLHGRLAVPAGYRWFPEVSAAVVSRRFSVSEGALALWNEDGTLTRLHEEHFVAASRGAACGTAEAMGGALNL